MMEIESMEQLSALVQQENVDWRQYGDVYTNEDEDLILFNYTPAAQYNRRWNWFERNSRGLILEKKTGKVVARPFSKFFNWGEMEAPVNTEIESITQKMDGSLGIIFEYQGKTRFATRGSLNSEQAQWMENHWRNWLLAIMSYNNHWLSNFDPDVTLLVEIIYPENRIVVDYAGKQGLWLLAGINRKTGEEYTVHQIRNLALAHPNLLQVTKHYNFEHVDEILTQLDTLDANNEGYVVRLSDGSRWKFKGEQYKQLHKLVTGLSKKRVFEAIRDDVFGELRDRIPDEWQDQLMQWYDEIMVSKSEILLKAISSFHNSPGCTVTRKEFAMWNKDNPRWLQGLLWLMYDDRDIDKPAWKIVEDQVEWTIS